ncbi:MAG: hypothetical protein LBK57_08260, partial [Clostridiales Family XIII bacterium]|nr:hypothetical protein [Clostridiales Family XIII bacterium]
MNKILSCKASKDWNVKREGYKMLKDMIAEKLKIRKASIALYLAGAAVVLLVFYALSLPALTAEGDLTCGLEEHTHTDECYEYVLTCGYPEDPSQGAPGTGSGSSADPGNAGAVNTTGSGMSGDPSADPSSDPGSDPAGDPSGDPGNEPHVHTAACYEKVLVCTRPEHTHSELCYDRGLMQAMGFGPMSFDPEGYSSDLADFLRGVVIKQGDNIINIVTDPVVAGEKYTIELMFSETDKEQFQYENDELTYQIPDGISIIGDLSGEILAKNDNDKDIGDYNITIDGVVTVVFDTSPNPLENFIDYYTDLKFTLTLDAEFIVTEDNKTINIVLGDETTIKIAVDNNPYLSVTKAAGPYDPLTRTIPYTVKVTAHRGTICNIALTDVMGTGTWYFYDYYFRSDKLSIQNLVSVTWDSYSATVSATPTGGINEGGSYNIPLTDVVLTDGQTAMVTYTVEVSDELLSPSDSKERFPNNGHNIYNTVTAVGHIGTLDGEEVTAIAKADRQIKIDHLVKNGEFVNNGNIKWSVSAGDGSTDMKTVTITDTLGPGHYIDKNTMKIWLCTGLDKASTIMGDANTGTPGLTILYTPDDSSNPTGFSFTPPSSIPYYIQRVFVEYETVVDDSLGQLGGSGYSNTVSFEYDERGEYEVTAVVGGFESKTEKTGELIDVGNNGIDINDYIEYTITVQVPGAQYGKTFAAIEDVLTFVDSNGGVYYVENRPDPDKVGVKIEYLSGGEVSPAYSWDRFNGFKDTDPFRWYMKFSFAPNLNSYNAPWQINADSIITITYKIPLSTTVLNGPFAGESLAEALKHGTVINKAGGAESRISGPIFKTGVKAYKSGAGWLKEGESGFSEDAFYGAAEANKGFYYTVLLNPVTLYDLAPNLVVPIFKDIFDPQLELYTDSVIIKIDGDSNTYGLYDPAAHYDSDQNKFEFSFADIIDTSNNQSVAMSTWNDKKISVSYVLRFKTGEEATLAGSVKKFNNIASVDIYDDNGTRHYESSATVDYGRPVVTKEMKAVDGAIVDVKIVINPNGDDLAVDTDEFTVVDDMSDTLSFVDLAEIKVTIGNNSAEFYTDPDYDPVENSITMKLPDKKKIVIEYQARVAGSPGEEVNINNTVSITGHAEYTTTVGQEFVVEKSDATAGYSRATFYLKKTDIISSARLPGAVFALYNKGSYTGWQNTT